MTETETKSTLYCYGGTGSVTGANFVLESSSGAVMVDCGLEQGVPRSQNPQDSFPYDPKDIDAVIITHAHMDHIGRLPLFVRKGYNGPIYSTPATKEVAALMFDDALSVMAEEEKERGIPPLYEKKDVERTLLHWQTRDYHQSLMLGRDDINIRFLDAGHVLGSAMVEATRKGRTIVFTGDLGNVPAPFLRPTEALPTAHYLVIESVYGDRVHEGVEERRAELAAVIEETRERKGTLLIPAFSLERTQVLLYEIKQLIDAGTIKPIDTYLDSPLATHITEVYRQHTEDLSVAAKEAAKRDDLFTFPGLVVTEEVHESEQIKEAAKPKIIIAGSGMSHGGRIRTHEKEFLDDKDTTILFVGYQAIGTPGRRIQEGQKKVRIDDTWVRVRARVETLHGYSAHADRDGLLSVVESGVQSLEKVFVAMGEPHSAMFLAQRVRDYLGVDAIAPTEGESFVINW